MNNVVGTSTGIVCGIAGASAGLYFAWHGFSSTPYTGQQLGEFCSAMGALVGCTCAAAGVAYHYWSTQLRHETRGRAD